VQVGFGCAHVVPSTSVELAPHVSAFDGTMHQKAFELDGSVTLVLPD
jgi:hypothetical protein